MSALRRLLGFVAPQWRRVVLAVLLGAATVGAGIGLMGTSAFLIAAAALHPSIGDLQVAVVGVRFFGISRGVFRYAERLVSHDLTFRLLARLRVWFYASIEPLAPARLTAFESGDLLARIVADIESLEHFFVRALGPPLVALTVAAGTAGFLLRYHPALAGLQLAFLAAGGLATPLLVRALARGLGPRERALTAALHTATVDTVQGLADLLAYDAAGRALARVRRTGHELARVQRVMGRITALDAALSGLVAQLGIAALLMLAIPMVSAGAFDGVGLTVLTLVALSSFEAVQALPAAAQHLEGQLAAARRLFEIVDARPEVTDPPDPVPLRPAAGAPVLRVRALSFAYPSAPAPALERLDLELRAGRRLALVGPSGAGKSTLVALLLRFWEGWEGEIELFGHDIRRYRQADVRTALGAITQRTHLFAGSLRDNLLLARPGATPAELEAACARAQLTELVRSLPEGLDTWIGERGVRLSGGERQRLAVARVLLRDPAFLILDEPTANLDRATEARVLEAIHGLMEGRTTLMATHRLTRMETFDEILVLDRGRIVERGKHAELVAAGGLYARLFSLQHGWTITP